MSRYDDMEALYKEYQDDPAFSELRSQANFVPGEGNSTPSVIFIGEAPGADEDKAERPFVGPSGKVLNRLLEDIDLTRADTWITNVVKYRPPGNRDPHQAEIDASMPYLKEEVEILDPEVIAFLGRHALNSLWPGLMVTKVHGHPFRDPKGRWHVPLFHPATALYEPTRMRTLRLDMQVLASLLED